MSRVNLDKRVYSRNQYTQVIDTQFTQLVQQQTKEEIAAIQATPSVTVSQFFSYYNEIFSDIPKLGDTNSHEYLIKRSSEYIGFEPQSEEIEALLQEINSLRTELLETQVQLAAATNPTS
jgi:hypothetical protein